MWEGMGCRVGSAYVCRGCVCVCSCVRACVECGEQTPVRDLFFCLLLFHGTSVVNPVAHGLGREGSGYKLYRDEFGFGLYDWWRVRSEESVCCGVECCLGVRRIETLC